MLGANEYIGWGIVSGVIAEEEKYGRIKQTWSSDCHRNELRYLL
jgi:hypothetical protein